MSGAGARALSRARLPRLSSEHARALSEEEISALSSARYSADSPGALTVRNEQPDAQAAFGERPGPPPSSQQARRMGMRCVRPHPVAGDGTGWLTSEICQSRQSSRGG